MDAADTLATAAQDHQAEIDQKTSFGRYMLKEVKQFGIMIAGAVVGYAGFKALRNTKAAEKIAEKISTVIAKKTSFEIPLEGLASAKDKVFPVVGAVAGAVGGGIVNTYGHWKKTESEALAVGEINADVVHLVQERRKFADTLTRQEQFVQDLLKEREARSGPNEVTR